jgi:hypothetical protein
MFPKELTAFRLPNAIRRTSLLLDGKFKLYIWIAKHRLNPTGKQVWYVQPPPKEQGGITVLCTLKPGNVQVQNFYVYPALNLNCIQYSFGSDDSFLSKGIRLVDLSELCRTAREILVQNAIPVRALEMARCRRSTLDDQLAGRRQPDINGVRLLIPS